MTEYKQDSPLLLGVIGDPIHHSKSPAMHGAALAALGIAGAYVPMHVKPEALEAAVQGIRALGFRGINVTIPHKVAVMPFLDRLDESARDAGAVNTIVNDNGILTGFNTDGIGYVRSLKAEAAPDLRGARILVLGAGGAAKGIVTALLREQPGGVVIANRTSDKARELAEACQGKGVVAGIGQAEIADAVQQADIVINTTSVGMYPHIDDTPMDTQLLRPGMIVSDLIYNPLRTRLLLESLERGCMIHGGLGMFVNQGAYALEYWTGLPAPTDVMRRIILESLGGN